MPATPTYADIGPALDKHVDVMNRVNNRIDEFYGRVDTIEKNMDQMVANGTLPRAGAGGHAVPDVARLFAQSEQFAAMKAGATSTGRVTLDSGVAALRNATTLTSDGDSPFSVPPQHDPRLGNAPARRLQLLDVLPVLPVESGVFQFNQLDGYVNAAAIQATQGAQKAQADVPTAMVSANIATIAHFIRASQQVLQDASQLSAQLSALLSYGVRQKLEDQLLNGPGGVGQINGLVPQATAYASTFATAADKIGDAATSLASAGWAPSVVVMNPVDWYLIASAKNTGDGAYTLGSPRDPTPASLWGLPVALSPALAAGGALVLDASQTALLDRMQVVVMASREDGANFTSNLVTLLAECRAGLAVFSPSALLSVSLAAATGD